MWHINNIAGILIRRGNYDEAVQHLREALRLKPVFAEAHLNMGLALMKSGNYSERPTLS